LQRNPPQHAATDKKNAQTREKDAKNAQSFHAFTSLLKFWAL
jgi:hypothetical protein